MISTIQWKKLFPFALAHLAFFVVMQAVGLYLSYALNGLISISDNIVRLLAVVMLGAFPGWLITFVFLLRKAKSLDRAVSNKIFGKHVFVALVFVVLLLLSGQLHTGSMLNTTLNNLNL